MKSRSPRALFMALPLHGHLRPLTVQARVLLERGWCVSVASLDIARRSVDTTVPFASLGLLPPSVEDPRTLFGRAAAELEFGLGSRLIATWSAALWASLYDGGLAVGRDLRPDLVVTDVATPAGLDVAEALGIPVVINNPDVLPMVSEAILSPSPDVPLMHTGHGRSTRSMWARLLHRPQRTLGLALSRRWLARLIEPHRAARGLRPTDVLRRAEGRRVVVNTVFGLEYERALPSNISMVGPMFSPREPPLSPQLQRWLSAPSPVVYVNLGTITAPSRSLLERIADGLARCGLRSLWVLRGPLAEVVAARSPRTRVVPWVASQMTVLAHPNVRAFVSHCGVNSVHESIACGVPLVGIPLFADQPDMGFRAVDAGVAVTLDKTRLSATDLCIAIEHVVGSPEFIEPMAALQQQFRDAGGAERAAHIIEDSL